MLYKQSSVLHILVLLGLIASNLLLLGNTQAAGQSLMFSQYYFSPLNINPALAGTYQDIYLGVNYRSQWRDLHNPYQASLFSYAHPIFASKPMRQHIGNVAFSAFSESAGHDHLYKSWGVNAAATYNLSLDYQQNYMLIFGLQGGIVQKSIDVGGLRWGSQYNPLIGYDGSIAPSIDSWQNQRAYPVFSTGFLWFYNPARQYLLHNFSAFTGMSIANLNRPNSSFSSTSETREPWLVKVHGGLEYALSSDATVLPNMLAVFTGQGKYYLNLGTYLHYEVSPHDLPTKFDLTLVGGVWYRWKDSFVFSGGLDINNLRVATSIDLNQKRAGIMSMYGGAFEVAVAYKILRKSGVKRFSTPMI